MKKLFILFLLTIVSIVVSAQTASFALKNYNDYTWYSNYTLTNAVADTFIINAPRNYPATQSYSVNLDSASGDHTNVAISLYGSLLGVSYTQIGSTSNWTGTNEGTTTVTISNTTANRYNYYKIIILGTGTGTTTIDWQRLQIWTSGELSDGTATLSNGSFTGVVNLSQTGRLRMGSDGGDSIKLDPYHELNPIVLEIDNVSKFSVDSTGIVTAAAKINAGNGVDLGTSKALTGTTGLTVGAGTETVAINSSDWDIGATGAMTGIGAITADGLITGTLGATISGATTSVNASSNFATNIGTGTSTGAVSLGGGSNTVAVNSTTWDITTTGVFTGMLRSLVVNTDETETLTAAQSNCVVTTDGAATITIPDPSAATIGVIYYVLQTADADLIVTATTANSNSIVCDGVATSDAVTISTASHKIGAGMIIIGISATQWYIGGLNPESLLTPEAAD